MVFNLINHGLILAVG